VCSNQKEFHSGDYLFVFTYLLTVLFEIGWLARRMIGEQELKTKNYGCVEEWISFQ